MEVGGTKALTFDGSNEDDSILNIEGGDAADALTGGDQADEITGGKGNDTIDGGAGADTFVFADTAANNGTDVITGTNADILDVSAFETVGAVVDGTGTYTVAAGQVVALGSQAAGAADSEAAAIVALNAAGVVTAATATNMVVISDDDSTSIYEVANTGTNTEYTGATFTEVATITGAVYTTAELLTGGIAIA